MTFIPQTVTLHEGGPNEPYRWLMEETLVWHGWYRDEQRELEVEASPEKPFSTDLASVPRSLTWLFPRYGKYTKAAVLHDYLCQNFRKAGRTPRALLPLRDRSDADEVFRIVMGELGVPRLRRLLMWAAVSWATLFTSLVPGRRSKPVLRWVGRLLAAVAVIALSVLLGLRHDVRWLIIWALVVPAALLLAGTIALGRADRADDSAAVYGLTLLFAALLGLGAVVGLALYFYLFLEDLIGGLPATCAFFRDLFSREAKARKIGTPQFARIAAVYES